MDTRVFQHRNDHQVGKVDYCLVGLVSVVGVAMVAFSVAMLLLSVNSFGVPTNQVPPFVLIGTVGILGCGLTFVSMKWMVESCRKSDDWERWVSNSHVQ